MIYLLLLLPLVLPYAMAAAVWIAISHFLDYGWLILGMAVIVILLSFGCAVGFCYLAYKRSMPSWKLSLVLCILRLLQFPAMLLLYWMVIYLAVTIFFLPAAIASAIGSGAAWGCSMIPAIFTVLRIRFSGIIGNCGVILHLLLQICPILDVPDSIFLMISVLRRRRSYHMKHKGTSQYSACGER